jgi:hypothetical protein
VHALIVGNKADILYKNEKIRVESEKEDMEG